MAGMEVYEDLRRRRGEAVEAGRLEEALPSSRRPGNGPRAAVTRILEDRALLNRNSVLISLGRGDAALPQIREILVRNLDPVNCRLAAYNIARIYE